MRYIIIALVTTAAVVIGAYFFTLCLIIQEQGRRDIVAQYIKRVKLEIVEAQSNNRSRQEIVVGSPAVALSPLYLKKETVCADANKIALEGQKFGANFLISGNASSPASKVSINGATLVMIIVDSSVLPDGAMLKEVAFDIQYRKFPFFPFRGTSNVLINWLACGASMIAIPRIKI